MVNKNVLRETFMKLESYDRINIMSDILRSSNYLELEFYTTVIESILKYHKKMYDQLREEFNHIDYTRLLATSDCIDSTMRSKLISTLSLLNSSNISGAGHIFEFLRGNYSKFRELAYSNPNAYEEVLLIYQLANDHPAFNIEHCEEIYDYLQQIRSIQSTKDYSENSLFNDCINNLTLISIEKNDKQEYVYRIKVKWDRFELCIKRTLEDMYKFYVTLFEMFPVEVKSGEIGTLYLSCRQDDLELSKTLLANFLKKFLNCPPLILRCDFVRQFFKPRNTDKSICDCDSCHTNFSKMYWSQDQRYSSFVGCPSSNNPSDNEYNNSYDKIDTPCSSNYNFSTASNYPPNSSSIEVSMNDSVSTKPRRNKPRTFHSTGSSPINTPSDESEVCSKADSLKHNAFNCHLRIQNSDITSSSKNRRTENWLCQANTAIVGGPIMNSNNDDLSNKSIVETLDQYDDRSDPLPIDISKYSHCTIGNLLDWLKCTRLHKYHRFLSNLTLGEFFSLTEESLTRKGFAEGASKKLISLILTLRSSDVISIDYNTVNLVTRERSNSTDSSSSTSTSCTDFPTATPDFTNRMFESCIPFAISPFMPHHIQNIFMVPTNLYQTPFIVFPPDKTEQISTTNKS